MYERFTDRARKVMQLANHEAQRFNHEYIGPEHILLGLVKEGDGVAACVLQDLDVDLRRIRLEVEKIVQQVSEMVAMGKKPYTPRAKKVIEYSFEEARSLNHNYVGTEHLLLGLLREQEGVAAQVLMNLGIKLEKVREEVLNLLGHGGASLSEEEENAGLERKTFRLSVESRGVLQHAMEQAEALNHGNLSTGHFLLGFTLLTEGPVFECLEKFKIDTAKVRAELEGLLLEYPPYSKSRILAWTESLNEVSRAAHKLARSMSPVCELHEKVEELDAEKNQAVRDQKFEMAAKLRDEVRALLNQMLEKDWDVEPAHLLLGLLEQTDSVGVRILQNLGLASEQLREEVIRRLGEADT